MRAAALLTTALLLVGCRPQLAVDGGVGSLVPDFSLNDENPASTTGGQQVSPSQYRGRVSAWYFGHSS
jgi:hypothetical protein